MAYTKFHNPWHDADAATGGGDESTPLTAAALDYIEAGIEVAAATGDSALALAGAAIPKSIVDAAGDLIVGSAADTVARLAIGNADEVASVSGGTVLWRKVGNAMIATGAAIDVAKLAPGTDGYVLSTSAGTAVWSAPSSSETFLETTSVTADANITGTSSGSPSDCIVGTGRTYAAVETTFEFYSPGIESGATDVTVGLYDGTTLVAILYHSSIQGGGLPGASCFAVIRFTPSAASHTYGIKAWVSGGTGHMKAGTGAGGAYAPATLRISV